MADVLGYDPQTGAPTSVPQEAAGSQYKSGKIAFKKGERLPVKVRGVVGTMPAEDVEAAMADPETSNDIELNFDPHGTAKAAAAGTLSGATMGISDWMSIEGARLRGGDPAAERARQSIQALRDEHGFAYGGGELAGGVATALIPGGAEADLVAGGAKGAREAAAASELAGPAVEGAAVTQGLTQDMTAAKQLADAQAATGATRGSLLARTLRAANPYEYVGRAGQVAADLTGNLPVVSPLARYATEGSLIGAANAVDESELGDTDLTGETMLANMEHGALWGTGLGLVGTGAERILTGAGRTADHLSSRLAEAQLGGSPREMGKALDRFGPGTLGRRMLEEGWTPFMSAEETHNWAKSVHEKDGMDIGRVVHDADSTFQGVPAEEVHAAVLDNLAEAKRQYVLHGGNPELAEQLEREVHAGLGLKDLPERDLTPIDHKQIYKDMWEKAGLPDPDKMRRPRKPSDRQVELIANKAVREQVPAITAEEVQAEQIAIMKKTRRPVSADDVVEMLKEERGWAADKIRAQVKEEVLTPWRQADAEFERINKQHADLRMQAEIKANHAITERDREFERLTNSYKDFNAQHKVSYEQARAIRQKIDKLIPWNRSADAVTNAAAEMKRATRKALEGKIEESLDREARKFKDPAIMDRYLNAKQRYAESEDLVKMSERGRNRHAGMFGRPSRVGGTAWPIMSGIGAVAMGHPAMGAMAMVGGHLMREKGAKFAAWALHKAAKLAGVKAVRQEVQIANRRAIRRTLTQDRAPAAAKAAEQSYFRVVPTGKDIFNHTSKVGGELLQDGHVFAVKNAKDLEGMYSWSRAKKNPENFEMVEFTGSHEYHPPENTYDEAYGVKPKEELRRMPLKDYIAKGSMETAKLKIQEMAPHEARATAAEAMEKVMELGATPASLRERLASQDPSLPIHAPKSFEAAERTFRSQINWLIQQIPPRLKTQLQTTGSINPRDLSDQEARGFLEHAVATIDPRAAPAAMANGTLTANMVAAHKANWPSLQKADKLQVNRMRAMDRDGYDYLPTVRRGQLEHLYGDTGRPDFTLALQANNARAFAPQPPPQSGGGPKGMSHAAATSKGMSAMVALNNTAAQTAESGPPGRRGRSGRSAESNSGF